MKYTVNGAELILVEDETLVAGEVKVHYAEFEFDNTWTEYAKTAVFKRDGITVEQILAGDRCEIPWEVLTKHGILRVGVYGSTADKTRPTLWAREKFVNYGACPGKASREPTPDKWQQVLALIEDIKELIPELPPAADEIISAHNEDPTAHRALAPVAEAVTLSAAGWTDNSDIYLDTKPMRVGYLKGFNSQSLNFIRGSGNPVNITHEWQLVVETFTIEAISNFVLFVNGGTNAKYIQPYDLKGVRLYRADDASKANLFPEDIEEQQWQMQTADTTRTLRANGTEEYIHVARQAHNYDRVASAYVLDLPAGAYTVELMLRQSPHVYEYTVPVADAHSENSVTISPSDSAVDAYNAHNVRCVAMGSGRLVFVSDTLPADDIGVNVMISKPTGSQSLIFQTWAAGSAEGGNSSGGGMELLWENTNISEAFNSRTVTLSNQNYSKVLIVLATYYYYDWGEYFMSTLTVDGGALRAMPTSNSDGGSVSSSFIADMQFVDYAQNTVGASRRMSCVIDTSSGNIKSLYFDNGFSGPAGYLGYDDGAMMPVRIYGIS